MAQPHGRSLYDAVTTSLQDMPLSLSTVAMAVIRLTSDPTVSFPRIARAVSADAGLTTRIMRKANSAFYAGNAPVRSLPLAILKLGLAATRSLAIASSVHAMFRLGDPDGVEVSLWRHSLGVAIGSKCIARTAGLPIEDEVYVTGLVHDIGKLVLLQRFPEVYVEHFCNPAEDEETRLRHEVTALGFSHADLGSDILSQWNFGSETIAVVKAHHDLNSESGTAHHNGMDKDARVSLYVLCLANAVVRRLESNQHVLVTPEIAESAAYRHLGFTESTVKVIVDEIRERLGDELQIFGEKHSSVMQRALTTHPPRR